ncbi:hypothetical protein, partial [Clostridium sp. AF22-10]|uniref:hypothetical protein n=1 Tax=Clostridium sp. AF22-10 TaxID=2293004 RepID=UPI000FF46CE2
SMLYKQMISYFSTMPLYTYNITFSTMPLYTYNITPLADYTKDFNVDKQLKNYEKVLKIFHHFNMAKELQNVVSNTIRDGLYVGWMNGDDENGMFLMPLDVQYCRIYGKTQEGEWITYFDASFFDKSNNKDFIEGINNDATGVWDQVFIDGYNQYKSGGRDYQFFRLPPENTLTLIASTDDEFYVPLPYFLPLFKSLLNLLDTESLVVAKEKLQNYKLILNKIPLLNSENVDDFAISLELANYFDALIKEILPDLVGYGTVPYQDDSQVIDFEKSTSSTDTDNLNKAMNNLFANAGINRLIISSGDSSNANGIKYSNANDLGKMSVYLRRIESWLNYWIKNHITDGIHLEIFDQTQYNREEYISRMKDASSFGIGKMDYMCALGNTPYIAYNKLRFEALALNINQYAIPFNSSYTQSSGDINGRPTIPEEDLSSEGQATRNSGKNEDKGNK